MACATVTITDITQPVQSLFTLLGEAMQPSATGLAGYTVRRWSSQPTLQSGAGFAMLGSVVYVSVQASPSNGAAIVYKGDAQVRTDATLQGKEMAAGDTDVMQANAQVAHLAEIFITASANGAKVNLEWYSA